jgi:mono/diheme cytochrome c family protein
MNRQVNLIALALMLAGIALPAAAQSDAPSIAHGKGLVEANCSRCHAVGLNDKSPLEKAPVFRGLAKRYPIDALEEAFAEGIVTGHPEMPEFEATPKQIADIVAYISSIQDR